jgi:S-disulfanyl-L-cysteine oxidoreductase SoxD
MTSLRVRQAALILLVLFGGHLSASGQGLQYGIGRTATQDEISDWDKILDPVGKEIPEGKGTAMQGKIIYQDTCESCHGGNGINGNAPELTGYLRIYPIHTWDKIYRTMPLGTSGTGERVIKLTPDETYSLTAYILYLNGMAAENDILHKKNLPAVRIPDPDFIR